MRHIIFFLSGLVLALNFANASDTLKAHTVKVDKSDCSPVGDSPYQLNCHQFENGDAVQIQSIHKFNKKQTQFDLFITDGQSPHDLHVPIDTLHPSYNVAFPIEIGYKAGRNLLNRKKRESLIYRLDYTDYRGVKGFQIITVRLNNFLRRRKGTCTMSAFDSSTFSHIDADEREEFMRQRAREVVAQSNFVTRDCMTDLADPPRETYQAVEQSFGDFKMLEEGDSAESAY